MTEPPSTPREDVTLALEGLAAGEPGAGERLFLLVHQELRRIAGGLMRQERRNHTLQATEIVNEAWMRLVGEGDREWGGRAQFLSVAARAMRRILVDHARKRRAEKRGGEWERVTLTGAIGVEDEGLDILDLHDALERLGERSDIQAQIVTLRFFGGLTMAEVAATVGLGKTKTEQHWAVAKAWLHRELSA